LVAYWAGSRAVRSAERWVAGKAACWVESWVAKKAVRLAERRVVPKVDSKVASSADVKAGW